MPDIVGEAEKRYVLVLFHMKGGCMSGWFRALFLFSSFGPLYLLLAVSLYVQHQRGGCIASLIAFVCSFLVFLKLRSGFQRKSVMRNKVVLEQSLDENILTYLISYLPPLLIDNLADPKKTIPALTFYAVTVLLMLRIQSLYINPYFLMFGYRIYRVALESGRPAIVIVKGREVVTGDTLNLYEIEPSTLYFAN